MSQGFIYIATNPGHGVVYIGVTNNLARRMEEHRSGLVDGFTKKYHVSKLIYYECADSMIVAIEREKQLKGWTRKKKEALIATLNPNWDDLVYRI